MQELVGRLSALDPEATETLKVIAYFDALVQGHATVEVLLRGSAILAGCAAGYRLDNHQLRIDADGRRAPSGTDDSTWPSRPLGDGGDASGRVWLERTASPHANDDMILERLAIALAISIDRRSSSAGFARALATVVDATAAHDRRLEAAGKLALRPHGRYRAVAAPRVAQLTLPNALVSTPFGFMRCAILDDETVLAAASAGIGISAEPDGLARSWTSALVALRLASDREPVVHADELGGLIQLAEAADADPALPPDVVTLAGVLDAHDRTLSLLEGFVALESARAVAAEQGLHHSTVQARLSDVAQRLGYDIRSPRGRVRLSLALAQRRLADTRFE
ncbi:MAG: helix-turn-helix domain-containing protein [Microcella pacifica]|uniref:helix-turn-helix domain-containing protein n=1 Tax=Microcella pacifica TaxID=2591847 RepID=UPI0033150DB6